MVCRICHFLYHCYALLNVEHNIYILFNLIIIEVFLVVSFCSKGNIATIEFGKI